MASENKQVVLTRSTAGNKTWARYFATHGIPIYNLSTIATKRAPLTPELNQALNRLDQFDWLVFTSAAGVRHAQALGARPTGASTPAVAVIGDHTAAAARKAGWHISFQPSRANAATLAKQLTPVEGKNILLLRSGIATPELTAALRGRGATTTDLPVYQTKLRTEPDPALSQLLETSGILCFTFASPSAVRGLARRLTPADLALAMNLPAIAIGPSVAEALSQAGFANIHLTARPDVKAIRETIHAIR
ncbi:MAG: uroporphyrinogen-III C-methyltransferase / uroporphyrinogen-III synthase [Patescibacteria group bacterium]|nr:uroporphyrinogen-III C-methyltransferase / uroporphyrinogen-III synthase [Patescibacteria group bacterium]